MKEFIYLVGKILIFLISLLILDSLWHPFPAEYHFAWWFLWFQFAAFFTWDGQYPILISILWLYTIWLSVRGLPLSQNWDSIWNPFFRGVLGKQRVKHWENWSDRSYYLVYQPPVDNVDVPVTVQAPEKVKSILKVPVLNKVEETQQPDITHVPNPRQDDEMSVTADFSFDLDIDQVKAAMQEIEGEEISE